MMGLIWWRYISHEFVEIMVDTPYQNIKDYCNFLTFGGPETTPRTIHLEPQALSVLDSPSSI